MIDTAVILAAGKGERLNDISNFKSKPLTEIFGISLIERNICKLNECLLVKNFIVITGFNYKELEKHLGEIKQKPPVFSAVKKDGKRLYEYARKGKEVEVPTRIVTISEFEITDIDGADVKCRHFCQTAG